MLSGNPVVNEFMDKSFVRLRPSMEIYEAIDILLRKRITGAAVVDDDDKLVGILSERDCMQTLVQGAYNSSPMGRVADYMSTELRTVEPTTDILEVAGFFQRHIFRRLLVVEGQKLVGQITRRDLLRAIQLVHGARRS